MLCVVCSLLGPGLFTFLGGGVPAVIRLFDSGPNFERFLAPILDLPNRGSACCRYHAALRDPQHGRAIQPAEFLLALLYGTAGAQHAFPNRSCRSHWYRQDFHSDRLIFGSFATPQGVSVKTKRGGA